MQTVLLVIYLMVVIALIGVVLIQRSEGGGLGIGGGSGFMSARGTANVLTRTTAILAALFFVLALGMNVLSRFEGRPTVFFVWFLVLCVFGFCFFDSLGGNKGAQPANGQAPAPAGNGVPNSGDAAPQAPAAGQPAPAGQAPAATAPAQGNSGVPTGQ